MNPGENPVRASLEAALAEAETVFASLPLDDRRRPEMIRRIRSIEDALDHVGDDL